MYQINIFITVFIFNAPQFAALIHNRYVFGFFLDKPYLVKGKKCYFKTINKKHTLK